MVIKKDNVINRINVNNELFKIFLILFIKPPLIKKYDFLKILELIIIA